MFNSDDVELDVLLELLEKTEEIKSLHPFIIKLQAKGIKKGQIPVKVDDLVKYVKIQNFSYAPTALKMLKDYFEIKYIRGIPYCLINKKIKNSTRSFDHPKNIKKFQWFLTCYGITQNNIPPEYNEYDEWCYLTHKRIPLTKLEYNRLRKKYIKEIGVRKE